MRRDGRKDDEMRPMSFVRNFNEKVAGSVLTSFGLTKVLCTALVEEGVPPWRMSSGKGWVTGEYAMLPAATQRRKAREARIGKPDSRSLEISRLIGRALRSVVDLSALKDRTVWVDCDVLQADGGTRTAAISGAFIALWDALKAANVKKWPIRTSLAAVSVGIVDGRSVLDLDYLEDSAAAVDLNVVMTGENEFVELQGTAEQNPFTGPELEEMLRLAGVGIAHISGKQQAALES